MNKQQMIIEILLYELKQTKKWLIRASGTSSEKTVQHQLNSIYKNIDELIEATEKELGGKLNDTSRENEKSNEKNK